jgi:cytochrome c oxidase assembly protein subunit 15
MLSSRRFFRLTQITLVFLFLVIIAGSVVRATGSGMGCPDWPKCFGHWVPPTDVSQLPSDYRTYFKVQNESIAPFNALQTWTEYGNRLVGAILGVLMLIQVVFSWKLRKSNPLFIRLSVAALMLTGMEGVLGAIVVYKNLHTGVITAHMFLSLVIVMVQTYLMFKASGKEMIPFHSSRLRLLLGLVLGFTSCQILFGTHVRENVDVLLRNFDAASRKDILENAGPGFLLHASFAWAVLILNLILVFQISRDKILFRVIKTQVTLIVGILMLEIIAGEILYIFALPAFIQPVHLLLACLLFGAQWNLFVRVRKTIPA